MSGGNSSPQLDAVTIGGNNPLIVFFRPSSINMASNGSNEDNEAMIFHEALHGLTSIPDQQLEDDLLGSHGSASSVIDDYILNNVLSVCRTSGEPS
jgi:hypothetical protein